MKFTLEQQELESPSIDIVLPRRSLIILSGDARYKYKHSISKDLEEITPEGNIIHREKRISFTFREIIAWEDESKKTTCK
ncbi:hypothetical protein RMCBS344292_18154 [Rhizopus microsporus]|nr:hypothetical protein RMCBS344292_18154 [Rhizopus microsporus]